MECWAKFVSVRIHVVEANSAFCLYCLGIET